MIDRTLAPGQERITFVLLILFFFSGATSLAYQVLWVRELQLVFGTSTFAISTVLAAFMGGLAAGGFLMARFADRLARPLTTYGILEIGIGVYALVFPWLVAAVTPLYLEVWRALQPSPVAFGFIQFFLVGSTLLLPTAAMGATLPLLARFTVRHLATAGNRVGTLYAVNTLGAVVGTWLCGFVLLPQIGRDQTTLLMVGANLLLGLGAVAAGRWTVRSRTAGKKSERSNQAADPLLIPVCMALALAGFSVLVYEVAWTRLLSLVLGGSTYTFSLMLLTFLLGIAIGGKLGGVLADRLVTRTRLLLAFAGVEIGIAVLSYLSMYVYPELPFWYVWLFDWWQAGENPEAVWWISLIVTGLVMAPPTVLMGMHFPLAVRAVVASEARLGGPVGLLYGVSTLGGVLGAFLAGFILLPGIRMQGTIFVAATAELLAAALLVFFASRGLQRRLLPVTGVALLGVTLGLLFIAQRPPWNPLLMTAGMYHYVTTFDDHSRSGIREYSVELYDLLFYEEGLTSVVTVARNKGSEHMWLANNGKVDASTTSDMPTQVLLSALPMQFVEQASDVLIVGLASGISAGAAALSPAIEQLDIVEIEPAMKDAAALFSTWNRSVLSGPRVDVIHNDARNHLLLSEPQSYDMIVSEPSNPWISGVANLFTLEFLELGKTRLKPGGVWSQWIQMYGMDDRDLRSLLRTFAEVYPYVRVYASIDYADLVVLGSESPLDLHSEEVVPRLVDHRLTSDLSRIGIDSYLELASLFLIDRTDIMAMAGDVPLNTDDNMKIEYSAPLNLHRETRAENFRMLLEHAKLPLDAFGPTPALWHRLANIYQARGDLTRSRAARSFARELHLPTAETEASEYGRTSPLELP